MVEWKLTEEAKNVLLDISSNASASSREKINSITKKNILSMKDITSIKETLPENAPAFIFFNMLPVHIEPNVYKSSAAFQAKTEKLRRHQENLSYKKLIESVDSTQKYGQVDHMDGFGAELRAVNRQLISVVNVLITVVGSFFFGFSGVTYAYPHLKLDLATRFLIGLILATIVFFADLYFVIKSMDDAPDENRERYEDSHNLSFKEVTRKNEPIPEDQTVSKEEKSVAASSTSNTKERKKTKSKKAE